MKKPVLHCVFFKGGGGGGGGMVLSLSQLLQLDILSLSEHLCMFFNEKLFECDGLFILEFLSCCRNNIL